MTALVVATTAACASKAAHSGPAPGTAAHALAVTASNDPHQIALAEAHRIVEAYAGPPGSSIADVEPSGLPGILTSPSQSDNASGTVGVVGWLIVPGTPQDALTWAQAHPPAGSTLGDFSRSMADGKLGGPYGDSWEFNYSRPTISASVLSKRMLTVETAKLASGKTVIRLQAEVDWLPTRPASEIVPPTATVLTVVATNLNDPRAITKSQTTPTTTSDPAKVRKVADWVNALPMLGKDQMARSCPAGPGTHVTMTFRTGVDGPVVATLDTYPGPCSDVELTLGGVKQAPLGSYTDDGELVQQVDALLGIQTCPTYVPCG